MNQSIQVYIRGVVGVVLASGIVTALASFFAPSGLLDGLAGAPDFNYVPVAGLQNLQCMKSPFSVMTPQATERKAVMETHAVSPFHTWVAGCFPQVLNQPDWRVAIMQTINGSPFTAVYDLLGAEVDSQTQTTRLRLELVTN